MEQPVTERRHDARFRDLPGARATLRPGRLVALVDLSVSGALVQAERPLRPGGRVHLQIAIGSRSLGLAAHVVRCLVWAVDPHAGVIYRGALKFEQRCDLVGELGTHAGCAVPAPTGGSGSADGKSVPLAGESAPGRSPGSAK